MDVSLRDHTYRWSDVVIGSTLEAALYAKFNNSKLIMNGFETVHEYDVVGNAEVLKRLGYTQSLVNKQRLFNRLIFDVSLIGNAPITEDVKTIRAVPEENKLTVISKRGNITTVYYESLRIFDDSLIKGLPFEVSREVTSVKVYDWFTANIINTVKYEHFVDEKTSFARKITVRKLPKNLVIVESDMKENQLKKFNYSDTMIRLKAVKVLKEAGLTGQRNGYYVSNPSKPRFRPIKLDFLKRDVIKNYKPLSVRHGNILFDDSEY